MWASLANLNSCLASVNSLGLLLDAIVCVHAWLTGVCTGWSAIVFPPFELVHKERYEARISFHCETHAEKPPGGYRRTCQSAELSFSATKEFQAVVREADRTYQSGRLRATTAGVSAFLILS
jgi:hypothetical protein